MRRVSCAAANEDSILPAYNCIVKTTHVDVS